MSERKALRQFSKNQLIDEIINLRERLEKVEHYLKAFDNPHTPSSKQLKKNTKSNDDKEEKEEESDDEPSDKNKKKPRFPGKPKGSNGGGIKFPKIDDVKKHTLDVCPISGLPLGEPVGYRKKIIIDFPDKPIRIIEHRIMQYVSPVTGKIIEKDVKLAKGIYGKNLQSIVAMLKNLTNSHEKIADLMRELGAPSFSSATVQNIATKFIKALERERNETLKDMRTESYIHSDETGFREDGKNGYVWGIFTKTRAIFLAANSRAKKHIIKLLRNFKGVLIVDGYGGYIFYPLKQRCWAHLIREFKDCAKDNKEIKIQYTRLQESSLTLTKF